MIKLFGVNLKTEETWRLKVVRGQSTHRYFYILFSTTLSYSQVQHFNIYKYFPILFSAILSNSQVQHFNIYWYFPILFSATLKISTFFWNRKPLNDPSKLVRKLVKNKTFRDCRVNLDKNVQQAHLTKHLYKPFTNERATAYSKQKSKNT